MWYLFRESYETALRQRRECIGLTVAVLLITGFGLFGVWPTLASLVPIWTFSWTVWQRAWPIRLRELDPPPRPERTELLVNYGPRKQTWWDHCFVFLFYLVLALMVAVFWLSVQLPYFRVVLLWFSNFFQTI